MNPFYGDAAVSVGGPYVLFSIGIREIGFV